MNSDNHTDYVEQNKDRKTLLTMMTKIRAAQTLGATLCDRGMYKRAYGIYERLIKEALSEKMRVHFSQARQNTLKNALTEAAAKGDEKKDARNKVCAVIFVWHFVWHSFDKNNISKIVLFNKIINFNIFCL